MSVLDNLQDIVEQTKDLTKELKLDSGLKAISNELENGVTKTIDKAANYVIRAMPIPDCAKDVLIDIKDALKTKDIKEILSTAVKSSIREGMEFLGFKSSTIKNVLNLSDAANKGGLAVSIKNALDLISEKFLKNNLVGNYISVFFDNLKNYIQSNKFIEKLKEVLNKGIEKKDKFLEQIKTWYNSYNNMNLQEMNSIATSLNRKRDIINMYPECAKENGIVQNINKMVNSKNEKLSDIQLQLCTTL